MELRVAHLYPDVMNIYGDRGNVIALRYHCEARGITFTLAEINIEDSFEPDDFDVILIGGGQDREQRRIADDLVARGPGIRAAIEGGMPALAVCGGFQLFGHRSSDRHRHHTPRGRRRRGTTGCARRTGRLVTATAGRQQNRTTEQSGDQGGRQRKGHCVGSWGHGHGWCVQIGRAHV